MILRNRAPKINIILFTNLIFAFFPISFIFGNFVTNVNLILFCCLGIFHIRSKIHVDFLKGKVGWRIKRSQHESNLKKALGKFMY